MMNFVALGLLLSSLAAAGVWSPHPEPKPNHRPHRDDQLLREGHRVIVVEYERQLPPNVAERTLHPPTTHQLIGEAKDRIQEAASVLPNVGQGISIPLVSSDEPPQAAGSAKRVICDAYGLCKEKVSSLIGKVKEKTSEKALETEESVKDTVKKAGEAATELQECAKDAVRDAAEKASQLKEDAKETVKDAVDTAKEKVSKAKETAKDILEATMYKASQVKEGAKDAMEKATESTKETEQGVARNMSGVAKKEEHKAEKKRREVRGNLTDILGRAKEVASDAAAYVWATESGMALAATLQQLGFATAYGSCVWVTFVSSNVLATALPRQQFGLVQSKMYPVYFRVVAYSTALTFVTHVLARDRRILAERVQGYNLLGVLVLVLVNMFFLEPKATKVMFKRMKMEKEEGRGKDMADVIAEPIVAPTPAGTTTTPTTTTKTTTAAEQDGMKSGLVQLNRRLKRLNIYSSFLNILTLMSLSWHLVHLARQMQVSR